MIVAGMAASSHRTERNLELIDTSLHAKILGVTGRGPVAWALEGRNGGSAWRPHAQPLSEPTRVVRGVNLRIVVEVDICIPRSPPAPAPDSRRPVVQLVVGVTADIELLRPVKPHIRKVGS